MNIATRSPIDYDTLEKGDMIMVEEIERITGVGREDVKAYQLAQMKLASRIHQDMRLVGKPCRPVSKGDNIKILTDKEATEYLNRRHNSAVRQMSNILQDLVEVDTAEFDNDLRLKHDRRIIVQSCVVTAVGKARKECRLLAHKRTVPGIVDSTKVPTPTHPIE